ncbi:hypothetical protein HAX54_011352 [Datura stramonium]|uniref:RING-type E3 ubiquitin transferase (cysteine targeting) n=1 Tax=Datura stramonium TaxID=4076 RepID=A0ABS8THU3_DATST|nr:hypothetical protein [Datura stramonium]
MDRQTLASSLSSQTVVAASSIPRYRHKKMLGSVLTINYFLGGSLLLHLTSLPFQFQYQELIRDEHAVEVRGKVRTGLEGPGLTVSQKIWYCVATVGGQYMWARLQSFSAFWRWGDSEQRSLACRAWLLIQHMEGICKAASFSNLLLFLYTGRTGRDQILK